MSLSLLAPQCCLGDVEQGEDETRILTKLDPLDGPDAHNNHDVHRGGC